ncbi:hypothetical protein AS888_20745 [Peribacillus simplex]|uniref:YopX protein domain-containing protein n=1 Tax=Peribacillus simplex TaxID=1478 RepID=A0A109MXI0_9BACI|nr:YopX family protein [Peribacillus simplex]KWW17942.1 hypothetical protein AS888_20745 [Peribacillus simplex]
MKEIRVRAWDNVENKMYYLGEEEDIHFYFDGSGIMAERLIDIEECTPEGDRGIYGSVEKLEHLKYMLSTGLKDNAPEEAQPMEIFANDILLNPVSNEYYIVTWDEHYANFFLKNREVNDPSKEDYDFVDFDGDSLYVVGNIYENPELLIG